MIIRHPVIIFIIKVSAVFLLTITSASAYEIEFPPIGGLNVKLLGRIAEGYNNNITFASTGEDKIEGFLTTTELGLDMQYSGKRRVVGLNGLAGWQIPTKTLAVANSYQNIVFSFQEEFSEYDNISLNNNFTHTQVPGIIAEDADLIECRKLEERFGRDVGKLYPKCNKFLGEFGRYTGRFNSYSNTINFNYTREFSERVNIGTNYSYGQNWFSEVGTQDSYNNTIGINATFIQSIATAFSLSYRLSNSSYKNGGDISTQSFSVGMRKYITQRIYFSGDLGMNFTSSNDAISIWASFTDEIDEKTVAAISYNKEISISSDREELFNNWLITGNLSKQFLENLRGSLSGFYGQGTFDSTGIKDTLTGASAGLDYKFWENKKGANIAGRLGYTYSKLDSTDETRGYDRGSLDIGFTAGF